MDAGEVTLAPDDALTTIQRKMRDSGWGQIPVVEGDEVVSIAPIVAEQRCRGAKVDVRDDDVQVTVVVEVPDRRSPA